jgi:hypothetical protein
MDVKSLHVRKNLRIAKSAAFLEESETTIPADVRVSPSAGIADGKRHRGIEEKGEVLAFRMTFGWSFVSL